MPEDYCGVTSTRRAHTGYLPRTKRMNLTTKTADEAVESELIGPASRQIKKMQRIAEQYAAGAARSGRAQEVEYGDIESTVKTGERDDDSTRVSTLLDEDIRTTSMLC
jgi:hypothetical protein